MGISIILYDFLKQFNDFFVNSQELIDSTV